MLDKWIPYVAAHWREHIAPIVCVVALLLAVVLEWPYAYYVLLRLLVCVVSIYLATQAYRRKLGIWVWAFGANAALFNPVLPLRMEQSDWEIVNLLDAVFLVSWIGTSVYRNFQKGATVQGGRPPEKTVHQAYELLSLWLESQTRLRFWLDLRFGLSIRAEGSVVAATGDGFHLQAEGAELRLVVMPNSARMVKVLRDEKDLPFMDEKETSISLRYEGGINFKITQIQEP